MTRLNLLPWREMRRKEADRQLVSILAGGALLMVVILGLAYMRVSAMIEHQGDRNKLLEREIAKLDEQIKEIKDLRRQRDALLARMRVIQQLQSNRSQVVHVFDDLARKLPEGMYLSTFKQAGNKFIITGMAQSNARVSAFMRALDSSNWFTNPELDVINVQTKGTDKISQFSLRVTQANKTDKVEKAGEAGEAGEAEKAP